MDKFKLASSSFGERLKTGGAQVSRLVSTKVKEILQSPTPESKMVDDATSESMEEPNWGMNLRICAMINSEEFSGSEIVKAIKKKLLGKIPASQRLSLDLLETCTSNCEKVFSEVASEKVLDEMVRMIDDPKTDPGNKDRAFQLIRAWGESEDLKYLPVFHQTFMSLQSRGIPPPDQGASAPPFQHSLESYIHQQPVSPPERYPIPNAGLDNPNNATYPVSYGIHSVEEKKEFLLITRNTLDLLSSILNSGAEPKAIKNELTTSMVEKCKHSQPVVQRIVETTNDDEIMLFEALSLHDELQQVISKCEELETILVSGRELPANSDTMEASLPVEFLTHGDTKFTDATKEESTESGSETKNPKSPKEKSIKSGTDKSSTE